MTTSPTAAIAVGVDGSPQGQTVLQHAVGPVAVARARSAGAGSRGHAAARVDAQIDRVDDGDKQLHRPPRLRR
jgi:hypothetical protein